MSCLITDGTDGLSYEVWSDRDEKSMLFYVTESRLGSDWSPYVKTRGIMACTLKGKNHKSCSKFVPFETRMTKQASQYMWVYEKKTYLTHTRSDFIARCKFMQGNGPSKALCMFLFKKMNLNFSLCVPVWCLNFCHYLIYMCVNV